MRNLIIVAAMAILTACSHSAILKPSSNPVKDSLIVDYMTYVSQLTDCSFVDWEGLARMRIMQNVADWDESLDDRMHPSWKEREPALRLLASPSECKGRTAPEIHSAKSCVITPFL